MLGACLCGQWRHTHIQTYAHAHRGNRYICKLGYKDSLVLKRCDTACRCSRADSQKSRAIQVGAAGVLGPQPAPASSESGWLGFVWRMRGEAGKGHSPFGFSLPPNRVHLCKLVFVSNCNVARPQLLPIAEAPPSRDRGRGSSSSSSRRWRWVHWDGHRCGEGAEQGVDSVDSLSYSPCLLTKATNKMLIELKSQQKQLEPSRANWRLP